MKHGAGREVKEKGSPLLITQNESSQANLEKYRTKCNDANACSGAIGRRIKKMTGIESQVFAEQEATVRKWFFWFQKVKVRGGLS